MSLAGLDLNSTRVRAVWGPSGRSLAPLPLEGDRAELPLVVSLDDRAPCVGRAAFALVRARPHLACADFLPHLGGPRVWAGDRHRLDAEGALSLAFAALARPLAKCAGVAFTLPGYLDETQVARLASLARAAKWPLLGSLSAPIAAVLASPLAHDPHAGPGLVLVIDCDGHALSWSVVERRLDAGGGQLLARLTQLSTALGRPAWLRRLLDMVANRCVRQSRRDPRDSAVTEQALYEQLSAALDRPAGSAVQLRLQGEGWYHRLTLHAEEMVGLAGPLVRQAAAELEALLASLESVGELSDVVLTHAAAGLPGLTEAVRLRFPPRPARPDDSADYGELLLAPGRAAERVHVLAPDAAACMAHELALRIHGGEFPQGHLEIVALPGDGHGPTEVGPARLAFRGREHPLPAGPFTLGRDPGCDLVFESELYPHVSARHCDIAFDRRGYVVLDRSRHGTLVNDRPVHQQAALHSGDWIRLGPGGPVVRFLGESAPALPAASSW